MADTTFLGNRTIGWTFLGFVSLLGICVAAAFVYFIIVSMNSPTFLNDYVKSRPDIPAQMTITLEYESRTMKTMGVQVAFGFLAGLVFSGIGVLLFAAGANGALDLKSENKWLPITLTATAPGLAVLALGGIIIAIAVSKDVSRNVFAEMDLSSFKNKAGTGSAALPSRPVDSKERARKEPE